MSMLSEVISDGCLDKVTVVLLIVLLMLPGDTVLSVELTETITDVYWHSNRGGNWYMKQLVNK